MTERGKYIVIEGSDGTGKSTQAIRMNNLLNVVGVETFITYNDETGRMEPIQEPGGTPRANELRRRIKDKSIERTPWENVEWFTEARQSIWEEAINPALEKGMWVVTARSWLSTVAYQGYGEGIPVKDIEAYTREKVGPLYMSPDFVAILALQNETVRRERMSHRGTDATLDTFESMPESFQTGMQNGYVQYAEATGIEIIDASRDKDEVFASLWKSAERLFTEKYLND